MIQDGHPAVLVRRVLAQMGHRLDESARTFCQMKGAERDRGVGGNQLERNRQFHHFKVRPRERFYFRDGLFFERNTGMNVLVRIRVFFENIPFFLSRGDFFFDFA